MGQLDPSFELIFCQAISEQADALTQMLTAAVERFDEVEHLGPVLCDLVRRRMLYDVADPHVATVVYRAP
jgi:hypothetical protein